MATGEATDPAKVAEFNEASVQFVNHWTEFVDETGITAGNRHPETVLRHREECMAALVAAAKILGVHVVGALAMA